MAVTLRDVASRAGVSVATASRAFQRPDMVGRETLERVRAAAADVGYVANRTARALVTGRAGVYGVVVPDLENPFFPAVLKGAQARAHHHGVQLLLADAEESPQGELELVRTLAGQVDGIVLCSSRMDEDSLREAATLTPLTLVNRDGAGMSGVHADPEPGIVDAVRHLHRMGHRHLGYVGGPLASRSDAVRREAIDEACRRVGIRWRDVGRFAPSVEGGRSGAEAVLLTDVTAVLVYNDLMALALVDRLRGFGVSVPGDLSVVGWDDIEFASLWSPGLSTVRVPRYDMGAQAVDLLVSAGRAGGGQEASAAPQRVAVPTAFVPRGSTGRAPEAD